jgi:hypothetical protein
MHLINNRYNLFDGPGHAHRPRFLTGPSSAPTPSPPSLQSPPLHLDRSLTSPHRRLCADMMSDAATDGVSSATLVGGEDRDGAQRGAV